MKLTAAALAATAGLALAQPRLHERHDHRHLHRPHHVKRVPDAVTKEVYLPGPTVFVYELNGHLISEDEVRQGIANGTLRLGDDGVLSSAAPSPSPSSSSAAAVFAEAVHTSQPASSTPASSSPAPVTSAAAAASSSSSSSSSYSSGGGIDSDYDESVDCGTFPSAFGPVALDYLGLGGWTGIQNPGYTGSDGHNNIETLTSGSCSEGMFCSYACPAGYQKTQWPTNQGVTGQSVGGLKCSGGKLKLTRTSTKKLCEKGTSAVSIKVKNTMSKGAAICRTDYPGTESETIPVWAAAGSSADLACPDGASYYQKDGKATSAQYYVNPAGVSTQEGCQWGDSSQDVGNWAPLNIGVGYSSGKGWISIFQNAPTTTSKLDFTVEIQGDDISGTCRYSNGQYCSGSDYGTCNTSSGCTVAVNSGTAYFVFS